MSYAALMVQLDLESSNDARLRIAGDLAERFDAKLIGIAACASTPPSYAASFIPGDLIAADMTHVRKRMAEIEERFREAVRNRVANVEWRQSNSMPNEFVAREARAADLVIAGAKRSGEIVDPLRMLDTSDLVMEVGRPVLVVPPEAEGLRAERILVGWKDTRESRRAVLDALPLLKRADHVIVVEALEDGSGKTAERSVDDVVHWLVRHGVVAVGEVVSAGASAASKLAEIAATERTDLLVAGAYGHSRWREWVMGGVTRELVMHGDRCAFLSH
jgi:nucleotide-binding universal stress UspA family protein